MYASCPEMNSARRAFVNDFRSIIFERSDGRFVTSPLRCGTSIVYVFCRWTQLRCHLFGPSGTSADRAGASVMASLRRAGRRLSSIVFFRMKSRRSRRKSKRGKSIGFLVLSAFLDFLRTSPSRWDVLILLPYSPVRLTGHKAKPVPRTHLYYVSGMV